MNPSASRDPGACDLSDSVESSRAISHMRDWPFLLYGLLLFGAGTVFYLVAVCVSIISFFVANNSWSTVHHFFALSAGAFLVMGATCVWFDLFVLLPHKRQRQFVACEDLRNRGLTVVLTAYNDELSIGESVADFSSHPLVRRVIVVDNSSRDRTAEVAMRAGAQVVIERQPGYGKCVYRALREGLTYDDTELTLLCEGDGTFRAYDIDKFLAYVPHANIVNGTRIVEQLRDRDTQLTTFMYYGNFAVGKLLEAKHLGQGTFTDVGTTYKLCRNDALRRLLPCLDSDVNLEFNAHFLDTALQQRISLVECPITFHKRIGISKGGNTNNRRALRVGIRMMIGILFSWKHL
jgi:GT2 family glycosyltransferase